MLADQPLHGYELRRRLGEILGPIARLSFGSLYPALNRLEAAESVRVVKVTESRTGLTTQRGRKVYELTESGRSQFEQMLAAHHGDDDDKSFAFRLAFARFLSSEARMRLLMRRRQQLAEQLEDSTAALESRRDTLDDYSSSLMEHGIEATQNDIAWLDRLISGERQDASDGA